jgi:hypothetical protein
MRNFINFTLGRVSEESAVQKEEDAARMGDKRYACKLSVGTPEGKRPLRRSRCRWENYIKM